MDFKRFYFIAVLTSAFGLHNGYTQRISSVSLEAGNAVTALPIVGAPQLFYTNFHPYITVGAALVWTEKRKHAWEQTFNLGYINHRFVQHSIPLFTETVYRFNTGKHISLRAHLGVGYLHSIPGTDRFELNDDGEYEKIKNLGRGVGHSGRDLGYSADLFVFPTRNNRLMIFFVNYGTDGDTALREVFRDFEKELVLTVTE